MSTSEQNQTEVLDYMSPLFPLDHVIVKDPPLDSSLATLDQEFNDAFEQRMSRIIVTPDIQVIHAGDDMYKTLKIFRRVAQLMGEDWKPVFMELMKKQSPEMVERELNQIDAHKPLIRGYRALMAWKETSGSLFHMTKLIDALNSSNMADIAQETLMMLKSDDDKPVVSLARNSTRRKRIDVSAIENDQLNNKILLQVAKKLSKDWYKFGQSLAIDESELDDIRGYVGAEHEKLFKVLWSWKESIKGSPDCKEKLKEVLQRFGRQDVVEECFGAES